MATRPGSSGWPKSWPSTSRSARAADHAKPPTRTKPQINSSDPFYSLTRFIRPSLALLPFLPGQFREEHKSGGSRRQLRFLLQPIQRPILTRTSKLGGWPQFVADRPCRSCAAARFEQCQPKDSHQRDCGLPERRRFGHSCRVAAARRGPVGADRVDVENVHCAVAVGIAQRARLAPVCRNQVNVEDIDVRIEVDVSGQGGHREARRKRIGHPAKGVADSHFHAVGAQADAQVVQVAPR